MAVLFLHFGLRGFCSIDVSDKPHEMWACAPENGAGAATSCRLLRWSWWKTTKTRKWIYSGPFATSLHLSRFHYSADCFCAISFFTAFCALIGCSQSFHVMTPIQNQFSLLNLSWSNLCVHTFKLDSFFKEDLDFKSLNMREKWGVLQSKNIKIYGITYYNATVNAVSWMWLLKIRAENAKSDL